MLTLDKLHALLDDAAAAGLHVHLSVHDVPAPLAFSWLDRELVSAISKGAGTNPPTVNEKGEPDEAGFEPSVSLFLDRASLVRPPAAMGAGASS